MIDVKKDQNLALYRKYRPDKFEEVLGQDHIVRVISESLKIGKIAHAYILSGPRGIGKTTVARIIAKELGTSVNDIYEMDAASNRGIDDVRDINENIRTLPFDSKYKIYILDEVHMFTKDAWNALLKTIEEPPSHVIFILATTEIEKVPETIISRCQNFTFKKPNDALLSSHIKNISKKEGYKIEEGGAELIALLAGGAFRDALGILQKVISFSKDKTINIDEIEEITGAPNTILVDSFLESLAENDIEKGFMAIEKAIKQNIDIEVYLKMILHKLRYALILRHLPKMEKSIIDALSERDMTFLIKLISTKPEHISSQSLVILLDAYQSLRSAVISQLPLELALIKIFNVEKK